jgi:hypothetical protein
MNRSSILIAYFNHHIVPDVSVGSPFNDFQNQNNNDDNNNNDDDDDADDEDDEDDGRFENYKLLIHVTDCLTHYY